MKYFYSLNCADDSGLWSGYASNTICKRRNDVDILINPMRIENWISFRNTSLKGRIPYFF